MTEGKLQKIIDLRKAIAICECIIGDLQEGVWVSLKTPNTEEHIPDPLRMDGRFFKQAAHQVQRRISENVRG